MTQDIINVNIFVHTNDIQKNEGWENMGEMTSEVFEVLEGAKADIFDFLIIQGFITEDKKKEIINKQFEKVANNRGIDKTCINNVCSRGLGLTKGQFIDMASDQLSRRNNHLLCEILKNKKYTVDNDKDIIARMKAL